MKLEDLQYPIVSNAVKKMEVEIKCLENTLKIFENVLDNYEDLESYHNIKDKLEEIYEERLKAQE